MDTPTPDPLAPAAIAYTSGTTGYPKGAVHSQHNLMLPGRMTIRGPRLRTGARKADCFPLTILNMQILSTLLVPQCGGTAIVMDRVDPVGIAEWIERSERRYGTALPPCCTAWRSTTASRRTHSARCKTSGVVGVIARRRPRTASRRSSTQVSSTYGLTEVPTLVAIGPSGRRWMPTASGLPLPHLALHDRSMMTASRCRSDDTAKSA